jgi:hypothetical protein
MAVNNDNSFQDLPGPFRLKFSSDCVFLTIIRKDYRHGDLANYCQKNTVAAELQSKWSRQILEAIVGRQCDAFS